MTTRSAKGILKKPCKKPPSINSTASSSSWLSRIQSKIYTTSDDAFAVPALPRQDLKRVSFSVSKLTTEYLLYDADDDDSSTLSKQQQPQPSHNDEPTDSTALAKQLPLYYERACRLHEEKPQSAFMDLLRSNW